MYAYIHPALSHDSFTSNNNVFLHQFTWSLLPQDQFSDVITESRKFKNDDHRISRFRKSISSVCFCSLVPPCWLHDDALDFLVFALFRGKSHIGNQFSFVPSGYSSMLFNKKLPRTISVSNTKLFTTDLVFVPFNISKVHWVLAVIVNSRSLRYLKHGAWILYVDPQHPHLFTERPVQKMGVCDQGLVQNTLLRGLNYEIFHGKPHRTQINVENLVLKHHFGTVTEV